MTQRAYDVLLVWEFVNFALLPGDLWTIEDWHLARLAENQTKLKSA